MSVNRNIPQIIALRERVEACFGKPLTVHSDFLNLVAVIETTQRQHISESTLERVWGYSTRGYDTVSLRTLDVLAQYVGICSWDEFCRTLQNESQKESELFNVTSITTSDLQVGTLMRIGWQPNRICVIRYLGDNRFVAEKCENSTMKEGDTFLCLQFILGKELQLHSFCRKGITSSTQIYIVGQKHGLTVLQLIQ